MDLLSLLDQREKKHVLIIRRVLMNGGKMTASDLERVFDLSYNTLVSYLEEIRDTTKNLRAGVEIDVHRNTIEIDMDEMVPISTLIEHYYQQAINIRLIKHIGYSNVMTKPLLSKKLGISESSVQRRVSQINQQIKGFDIKISANRFVGPELQIRYFLYNVFSKIDMFQDTETYQSVYLLAQKIQKDIIGYNDEALLYPLIVWLYIAKKRMHIANISRINLSQNQIKEIKKDDLYLKIKKRYQTFFYNKNENHTEIECIYTYLFIISMGVLGIEDNYVQKMLKGNFPIDSLVAPINKKLMKTLESYFSVLTKRDAVRQDVKYQLIQMHLHMVLFDGFGVYFDNQTLEKKVRSYLDNYVDNIATEMLQICLNILEKDLSNEVWQLAYYRYQSIVYDLILEQDEPIIIGIDFRLNYILQQNMIQRLTRFLDVNVKLEKVMANQSYDLVITNYDSTKKSFHSLYTYRIAEFETEYDRRKIMALIEKIALERIKQTTR